MKKLVALVIVLWLVFGLIGSGFSNAYFTTKYKSCNGRQELGQSIFMSIGGPLNLIAAFLYTGFGEYGWTLKINNSETCR